MVAAISDALMTCPLPFVLQVQHFPRDAHCNILYCNVEGVTWLDDERFIFASDASKSVQGHECMDHDQSVVIAGEFICLLFLSFSNSIIASSFVRSSICEQCSEMLKTAHTH